MTLPEPRSAAGAHGLARLLRDPGSALLVMDFDGVLSPIVDDPEQAYAHPDVVPALRRIAPVVQAIAVLTGRPAHTVVRLGRFAGVPELSGMKVIGLYGAERLETPDGELTATPPPPGIAVAREQVPGLIDANDDPALAGVRIEDKGAAIVVHTRPAAEPVRALEVLAAPLGELAAANGLLAESARLAIELRPPGVDKGVALRSLVTELAPQTVLYAGDDLGDLPAFDAVEELRSAAPLAGGVYPAEGAAGGGPAGILVCSASAEVDALTERADLIVNGPAGVAAMLHALADRIAT